MELEADQEIARADVELMGHTHDHDETNHWQLEHSKSRNHH